MSYFYIHFAVGKWSVACRPTTEQLMSFMTSWHVFPVTIDDFQANFCCRNGRVTYVCLGKAKKILLLNFEVFFPPFLSLLYLCRIAALEADLEEEQTQSVMLLERERKSQTSVEQLTAELATERSMCLTFLDFFEV
jgi:hypothetical protein